MLLLLASIVVAATAAAPVVVEQQSLDVVFVPDAPNLPMLALIVDDDGVHRSLTWAAAGLGAVITDEQRGRPFSTLPSAPRGASVVDELGALSLTVDDASTWATLYAAAPVAKGAAMPIPGPSSLRLVVDQNAAVAAASASGASGSAAAAVPAPAVLYGASVKVAGRAIVRRDRPAVRAVVLAGGKDLVEAVGVAVDVISACGRTVPSAVSALSSSSSLKLTASGSAHCIGALAMVPVAGWKLDAKKDVAATGIVISRAAE